MGLAILTFVAWSAVAPSGPPSDPCSGTTQLDMNECAAQRFEAARARLELHYGTALGCLNTESAEELRQVQRAWLAYRDAECQWQAAPYEGGSIQPLVFVGCLAELTERRADALEHIVSEAHAMGGCGVGPE